MLLVSHQAPKICCITDIGVHKMLVKFYKLRIFIKKVLAAVEAFSRIS